jgi:hypothetical protein
MMHLCATKKKAAYVFFLGCFFLCKYMVIPKWPFCMVHLENSLLLLSTVHIEDSRFLLGHFGNSRLSYAAMVKKSY